MPYAVQCKLICFVLPLLDTRELLNVAEKNLKGDILVDAMKHILPNLPRRFSPFLPLPLHIHYFFTSFSDASRHITISSTLHLCNCIDRVKRLMS